MKKFAFFPGCLIPARHPAMEFAIRETLPKLGIEIVDLDGASCCPDPIYFKSKDKLDWLTVAARNLTLAEDKGLDPVSYTHLTLPTTRQRCRSRWSAGH